MAEAEADKSTDPEVKARIERMLTFVDTLNTWYEQVKALPKPTLVALMKMGSKVARLRRQGGVAKVARPRSGAGQAQNFLPTNFC